MVDGSEARGRVELQVTARTVWKVALHLVVLWALLRAVAEARTVLSWIAVALFLALAAHPPVRWLMRRGVARGGAIALVMVGVLALVALMVATVVPLLVSQVGALVQSAPDLIDQLRHTAWMEWLERRFDVVTRVTEELRTRAPSVARPVLGVVTGVLARVAAFTTITVLTVFFLAFGEDLFDKLLLWVSPERRAHWRTLALRMHRSVGGYVAGSLLLAGITGAASGIITFSLGVPFFLPIALVTAVLGVVPWVGSTLGAALMVGATFAERGTRSALLALGIFLAFQQVKNRLLVPLVQRHTLQMNPLLITLVMLLGTSLFGLLGTLLALPVAGAAQVLAQDLLSRRQARWHAEGRAGPEDGAPPPPRLDAGGEEARLPH